MNKYRIQYGYYEDGRWHNDVAGCGLLIEAKNERDARSQARKLLKTYKRFYRTRIAWVVQVNDERIQRSGDGVSG